MAITTLPVPQGSPSHLPGLLGTFPHTLSTDPLPVPAISWTAPPGSSVSVQGTTATIIVSGVATTYDLAAGTVAGLAAAMAARAGCTSVVASSPATLGGMTGLVIVEGTALVGQPLLSGSDVLWTLCRVSALLADLLAADAQNALQQLGIQGGTGPWIDYIGATYNTPRQASESDSAYGPRITRDVLAPYCNNVAMQSIFLQATAVAVAVQDAPAFPATFVARFSSGSPGTLPGTLTVAQIVALMNRYKAGGTALGFIVTAGTGVALILLPSGTVRPTITTTDVGPTTTTTAKTFTGAAARLLGPSGDATTTTTTTQHTVVNQSVTTYAPIASLNGTGKLNMGGAVSRGSLLVGPASVGYSTTTVDVGPTATTAQTTFTAGPLLNSTALLNAAGTLTLTTTTHHTPQMQTTDTWPAVARLNGTGVLNAAGIRVYTNPSIAI